MNKRYYFEEYVAQNEYYVQLNPVFKFLVLSLQRGYLVQVESNFYLVKTREEAGRIAALHGFALKNITEVFIFNGEREARLLSCQKAVVFANGNMQQAQYYVKDTEFGALLQGRNNYKIQSVTITP